MTSLLSCQCPNKTRGHTCTLTYTNTPRLKTHTSGIYSMMLDLARPSQRKNCDRITQGNNQGALPRKSYPSLDDWTSEAWVEVQRVWGEETESLEGRLPPLNVPFSYSQGDPSRVSHTQMEIRTHRWKCAYCTHHSSPLVTGAASSFTHTTSQYQSAHIVWSALGLRGESWKLGIFSRSVE